MTTYDIPGIVGKALLKALTLANIISGFRCSGIAAFNPDIFQECDFLASEITNRSLTDTEAALQVENTSSAALNDSHFSYTSTSTPDLSTKPESHILPGKIRPYPKAGPRTTQTK